MKHLPLSYVLRGLWVRRVSTVLTMLSMASVVFVFAAVLMLSEGIRSTLVATGTPGNLVVLRRGAGAEINSAIGRDATLSIATLPTAADDGQGRKRTVAEVVVLSRLLRRDGAASGRAGSVVVRGTAPPALPLRPQVRLAQGRMFREGTAEIVAGVSVARGFAGVEVGQTLRLAGRDWLLVGLLDGGGSAFDSEMWADAGQVMQAFRRDAYSSVLIALAEGQDLASSIATLESDRRLGVEAKPEQQFYAEQSAQLTRFIELLGLTLSLIFSTGAAAGAAITMLAAVAQRASEIGTLRALGFQRSAILCAVLAEAMALSLLGGVIGIAAAAALRHLDISTTNIQTLSELAFKFTMTPAMAVASLLFGLVLGLAGGLWPAWKAAQANIVDALRAR